MKNLIKKIITGLVVLTWLSLPYSVYAINTYSTNLVRSSTQYYTAADSVDFTFGTNATTEFWARFATTPADGIEEYFLAQSAVGGYSYNMYYTNEGGTLKFIWHTLDGSCIALSETYGKISYTVSTNTWYHVAYVKSGSTFELFINGVSQGTSTIDNPMCDSSVTVYVMSKQSAAGSTFDGDIDDFRIYNVAKTGAQILTDYNCEITDFTNLKVYYKFNNDANEVAGVGAATDNLTAVNTPTFTTTVPFAGPCGGAGGTTATTHPLWWNMF